LLSFRRHSAVYQALLLTGQMYVELVIQVVDFIY